MVVVWVFWLLVGVCLVVLVCALVWVGERFDVGVGVVVWKEVVV